MARITPVDGEMCYTMVAEDLGIWSGRVGGHSLVSERKENQDRLICVVGANERFVPRSSEVPMDSNSVVTIGVLDGHGRHGSWVAETAVKSFTQSLQADVEPPDAVVKRGEDEDCTDASCASEPPKTPIKHIASSGEDGAPEETEERKHEAANKTTPVLGSVEDQYKLLYNRAHNLIKCQNGSGTAKNGRYSGTTATLLTITPHTFTISNVGDTEAVVGRRNINKNNEDDDELKAHSITTSHRPVLTEERERVEAAGGVVEPQRNRDGSSGSGPIRIWLKDVRTPGLMVSRSLGDVVAHKKLGVIADPWVLTQAYDVTIDMNLIVASDGVWDVIGYDEAVRFMDMHDDPSVAARNLATMAVSRQRPRHHDNVRQL
jgi:serine/threonine protein phosphatase PrpC